MVGVIDRDELGGFILPAQGGETSFRGRCVCCVPHSGLNS